VKEDLDWTGIILNGPEVHGLEVRQHCDGYGSGLDEESDRCTRCGEIGAGNAWVAAAGAMTMLARVRYSRVK
jgi:hypothetical protein